LGRDRDPDPRCRRAACRVGSGHGGWNRQQSLHLYRSRREPHHHLVVADPGTAANGAGDYGNELRSQRRHRITVGGTNVPIVNWTGATSITCRWALPRAMPMPSCWRVRARSTPLAMPCLLTSFHYSVAPALRQQGRFVQPSAGGSWPTGGGDPTKSTRGLGGLRVRSHCRDQRTSLPIPAKPFLNRFQVSGKFALVNK